MTEPPVHQPTPAHDDGLDGAIRRHGVHELHALLAYAGANGIEVHRIGSVIDRSDLHDRMSQSWSFPGWYGRNFDALADALADFSWRTPAKRMLIIGPLDEFRQHDPNGYSILIEVLTDASVGWEKTPTPLIIVELTTSK